MSSRDVVYGRRGRWGEVGVDAAGWREVFEVARRVRAEAERLEEEQRVECDGQLSLFGEVSA